MLILERLKAEDFAHDAKLRAENLGHDVKLKAEEAKQKGTNPSLLSTYVLMPKHWEEVHLELLNCILQSIIWHVPLVVSLLVVLPTQQSLLSIW